MTALTVIPIQFPITGLITKKEPLVMIKTHIKITLPGKIIDVDGHNGITLEFPTVFGNPLLSPESRKVLTEGLSPLDSDLLIERIGHFAMTESVRARISMGGLTLIERSEPSKY